MNNYHPQPVPGVDSAAASTEGDFAPGPVVFKLGRPLTIIDRQVNELTLREPTGKDLRELGRYMENSIDYTMRMAERLAGIPTGALDAVSGRDALRIGKVIADFLADATA